MPGLFNAADLFGNVRSTDQLAAPQWEQGVTSADYGGGTSQLNPLDYATSQSAQNTANLLGGTVVQGSYYGTQPSTPELGISFGGNPGNVQNAGRVNQQLDYARRGRYNADTGQYDQEPLDVVLNRLRAMESPGQYMVGVHPGSSVEKPVSSYNAYNATNNPAVQRNNAAAGASAVRPPTTPPAGGGGGPVRPPTPPRTPTRPTAPPPTLRPRTPRR